MEGREKPPLLLLLSDLGVSCGSDPRQGGPGGAAWIHQPPRAETGAERNGLEGTKTHAINKAMCIGSLLFSVMYILR